MGFVRRASMKIRRFTALCLALAVAGIANGANALVYYDCVKNFPPPYTFRNCYVIEKTEFGYKSQCDVYYYGLQTGRVCGIVDELDSTDLDPHKKATKNLKQVIRDKIKQQVEDRFKYGAPTLHIDRGAATVGVRGSPL